MGLEPVSLVIKKSRLRLFGHAERKDWTKSCTTTEVKRTKPRLCPRKTWWDDVKEDMKRFGQSQEDVQSQRKWRRKDEISSAVLHQKLDLDEITAVLRTRRLRWYGHVQRATSCINSITRLGLPGTRDRWRPRKMWSACVRNMTICNFDGVNPLDRNSWRTSVRRCQVLPTPESGKTAAP